MNTPCDQTFFYHRLQTLSHLNREKKRTQNDLNTYTAEKKSPMEAKSEQYPFHRTTHHIHIHTIARRFCLLAQDLHQLCHDGG
jgi:hypothetical protein